jgi:hypothetical protein
VLVVGCLFGGAVVLVPAGELLGARFVSGAAGVVDVAGADLREGAVRAAQRVGGLVGGRDADLVLAAAAEIGVGAVADVGQTGFGRVAVGFAVDGAVVGFALGGDVGQVGLVGDLQLVVRLVAGG